MGCKCPSSYTAPAYIWAFLSILAAIACPFGIYFSNWIEITREVHVVNGVNRTEYDSFSSFRLCRNESSRFSTSCSSYLTFGEIFSHEWRAVTLLMGAGACFLVLVALTAIFGFFVIKLFNRVVVVLTVVFQMLGVILFITAIVLFPAGMGSNNVKVLCGSSAAPYHLGKCSIGWSYILVIVGTGVGVAAAAMSWTTYKWREKSHIQTYNV